MKIALITDTHFGVRSDSPAFAKYQYKFYDDIFFPYLEKNNIKNLIHLGDTVDRRKFINFKTLNDFRNKFLLRLWDLKIDSHFIVVITTIRITRIQTKSMHPRIVYNVRWQT